MTTATIPISAIPAITSLPPAVQRLFALKGQFASLRMVRAMKVRKGEMPIMKDSTFVCRIGVDYDNIAAVQEKRDNGELPAVNQGLPWGQWAVFPYLIEHKGEYYFRCTSVNGNNASTPRVIYLRNGQEISKVDAESACLASEFRDDERDVFNVTVSKIIAINGELI